MPNKKEVEHHHKLGGSTTSRWMFCGGSIREIALAIKNNLIPKNGTSSPQAEEGTRAHHLGEHCLVNNYDVLDFYHKKFEKVIMDESYIDAVEEYVDYVRTRVKQLSKKYGKKNVILLIEDKSDLSDYVNDDCGGSADAVIIVKGILIEIIDYKHGRGIIVEVMGNTQLRLYALGTYRKYKAYKPKKIIMTIVQPRAFHEDGAIRSEKIKAKEIRQWGKLELVPAVKATQDPNAPLVPGEKQCMWCPVRGSCKANASKALEVAQLDFEDFKEEELDLRKPEVLSDEYVIHVLEHKKQLESWLKGLYEYAHNRALLGTEFTDRKLVETWSNRKFKSGPDVIRALKKRKIPEDGYFKEPVLKSPAQIEAYLKTIKKYKPEKIDKVLRKFITREVTGTALVHLDDKRTAIPAPAKNDFADIKVKKPKKPKTRRKVKNEKAKKSKVK